MGELKPATVYFETHVHKRLKAIAAERGTTISSIVGEAVGHLLDVGMGSNVRREKKRLKLDWAGALADLKDEVSSVELQHMARDWRESR